MGFKREIAAKFNRFSVNHPRKKDILQINASVWGAAGIGMVLTPFDGGLTLLALLISGTGTGVVATMDKDEIKKHLNATGAEKVTVDGEEYVVTVSQAQKLEKCNKKIAELNKQYKSKYATSPKKAEKIHKEALRLRQIQVDILESDNIIKTSELVKAPDMDLTLPAKNKPKPN